ncbi:MAG TPA: ChbG/HpnK family deacetylase [Terriglobales bacterium]|nr:ChbG/HpnK family deacetylase [Terriglobales bacterium]
MRRLIINADDFGLTRGVNRAIVEGHEDGVITSSTLMANGPAFDNAVELTHSVPRLSVGCHVVLVDGSPVLPGVEVSSLVGDTSPARFGNGISKFSLRALTGRLDRNQIEAEVTAQIRKLQAAGIAVSHLDSHKHTHMFPAVFRPLLQAAKSCGVRAIRNPFEVVRISLAAGRPALWKRYGEVKLLRNLAKKFRQATEEAGLMTPDGTLGIVVTGVLDDRLFRLIIDKLPEGTWEFVCHPGYNDAELDGVQTQLRESREHELQVLKSPQTRDLLAKNGIELISYQELG